MTIAPPAVTDVRVRTEQELTVIGQRLHAEFDDRLDPQVVDECLSEVSDRFAGAKVQSFVPLLVGRYAREELTARTAP